MQVNRKMTLSEKIQFQISHYQTCFSNISTGLSGVGHEEASFREYVCEAYRLLQCTWLHPLQKLKCDGNILFTAEIKVTADGQKKMQIQRKSYRPKWEENQRCMALFLLLLQIPHEGVLHQLVPLVQAAKTYTHIHPKNLSIDVTLCSKIQS